MEREAVGSVPQGVYWTGCGQHLRLSALQPEQKGGSCSLEHLQQCHRAEEQIRSLCEEHSVRGWCALSFSPLP